MTSRAGTDGAAARQSRRPVVGVVCDFQTGGPLPVHAAGDKYLSALWEFAGATPLLIPALEAAADEAALLDCVDGVFLPGSPSNVDPAHYDGTPPREGTLLDARRDGVALGLIRASLARGRPLMAVCRGFQELNVALGGTLHQHLHETDSEPGFAPRLDHREDPKAPPEVQYAAAHDILATPGGLLAGLMGTGPVPVNSLHGQGIDRMAERLRVEARAPDGAIEAAVVEGTQALALGVQWHPEWRPDAFPHYAAVLRAFGDALAASAAGRGHNSI